MMRHKAATYVTSLHQLKIGAVGIVEELMLPDEVQHHLMHMGFVPEARVLAVRKAPAGDPTVYAIDGFEIALRRDTARGILISVAPAAEQTADAKADKQRRSLRARFWPAAGKAGHKPGQKPAYHAVHDAEKVTS